MRSFVLKMLLIGAVGTASPAQAAKMPIAKSPVITPGEGEFKLVREKGSVSLYERWFEVEPGLKVRELKAVFTVEAGTVSAINLLKDASRAPKWMQSLDEFELVENKGASWISYVRYSIPWPLEDQDVVLRYRQTNVDASTLVSFFSDSHPSYLPEKGVTRMQGVSGSWLFEPVGNKTVVTYKITTRNKSSIPRWITDPIVQDNMLDTMNSFCVQARELHAQR
ncbi:MAG: hypothetical protein IPL49_10905 [Saprospirales bacterium]|nr:hypothetical protein [Saprospirales bacterium]